MVGFVEVEERKLRINILRIFLKIQCVYRNYIYIYIYKIIKVLCKVYNMYYIYFNKVLKVYNIYNNMFTKIIFV